MMPEGTVLPTTDPVSCAVAAAVRELVPAAELYLFGSRARGDARPDSDWDFMVVVPPSFDETREWSTTHAIGSRVRDLLGGGGRPQLQFVWCRDYVWTHPIEDLSVNSLVSHARREARRLV